jgi:predicted permease
MIALLADLRLGFRQFRRAPIFAVAAVLSIGIGVGANTAIFSVTNALLLRPLPYPDPSSLAIVWNRSPGLNIAEDWFSTAQYFDIKTRHTGLSDVAIALGVFMTVTSDDGDPERIGAIRMSANLLPMLGARPAHGRVITEEDDRPGAANVAVLGHGTFVSRYGGDASVVGRPIILNGASYEIVGVLDREFSLPREVLPTLGVVDDGDVFLPLRLGPQAATVRTSEDYNIVARLAPGVTVAEAQAEMDSLTASLREEHPHLYPPNGGLTFSLVPMQEQVVGSVRTALTVLSVAVGVVLLVACANVANLWLARTTGRRGELITRLALGATRGRLVRQLLAEGLVLASAGGAVGLLLAGAGIAWIQAVQPSDVPRLGAIGIDARVIGFTFLVSTLAGLVFGLAPALGLSRMGVSLAGSTGTHGGSTRGALWTRRPTLGQMLVVAEVALSVLLLVGAGLLARSFANVQRVPPGFQPDGVLTFELALTGRTYPNGDSVRQGYDALWQRLRQLPEVSAVGAGWPLPLSGRFAWGPIQVEGRTPPAGERFINVDMRIATTDYFSTMRIPLVDGRAFTQQDTVGAPRVVIVDTRMAEQLWPGESAIGKRVRFGDETTTAPWETVVGVVPAVKQYALDVDGRLAMYRPHLQQTARSMWVTARTDGDVNRLTAVVRAALREVDADLPMFRPQTMTERVAESLARRRFLMTLLGLFASVAAVLATIGVYGVMTYLVSQGTRDLGIRMMLGASAGTIRGMVLRQGFLLGAAGVVIGLMAAAGLTHLLESLLFGVAAIDAATFIAVAAALAMVAAVAALVPAHRASRTDPASALRS